MLPLGFGKGCQDHLTHPIEGQQSVSSSWSGEDAYCTAGQPCPLGSKSFCQAESHLQPPAGAHSQGAPWMPWSHDCSPAPMGAALTCPHQASDALRRPKRTARVWSPCSGTPCSGLEVEHQSWSFSILPPPAPSSWSQPCLSLGSFLSPASPLAGHQPLRRFPALRGAPGG